MNQRDKFTCALCKLSFIPQWTEEEALQEKKDNFDDMPLEEMKILCTDCYNKVMAFSVNTGLHKKPWRPKI